MQEIGWKVDNCGGRTKNKVDRRKKDRQKVFFTLYPTEIAQYFLLKIGHFKYLFC